MIMSMYETGSRTDAPFRIFCVTNRTLCGDRFLQQMEAVARSGVDAVILREKDLPEKDYEKLALEVRNLCRTFDTAFTVHHFSEAARRMGCRRLHLPMGDLRSLAGQTGVCREAAGSGRSPERHSLSFIVGASVHSPEEAAEAEALGASYVTAGHVFVTDCKAGMEPRGLEFLRRTVETVSIPVFAIGGIAPDNIRQVREAGAAGACIMSGFMKAENPAALVHQLRSAAGHR